MARPTKKTPGERAYPLDPDINPWEQQPEESNENYRRFVAYRDSEHRNMKEHSTSNTSIPQYWAWGHRAYQWDLYMARVDEQDMIRYRRLMNDRMRRAARVAQAKAIRWLEQTDPAKLGGRNAIRLLEVGVKIEREAAGADLPEGPAQDVDETLLGPAVTLQDMLGSDEVAASQIAGMLARLEDTNGGQ